MALERTKVVCSYSAPPHPPPPLAALSPATAAAPTTYYPLLPAVRSLSLPLPHLMYVYKPFETRVYEYGERALGRNRIKTDISSVHFQLCPRCTIPLHTTIYRTGMTTDLVSRDTIIAQVSSIAYFLNVIRVTTCPRGFPININYCYATYT